MPVILGVIALIAIPGAFKAVVGPFFPHTYARDDPHLVGTGKKDGEGDG